MPTTNATDTMDRANPALSLPNENAQPVPKLRQNFRAVSAWNLTRKMNSQIETKGPQV